MQMQDCGRLPVGLLHATTVLHLHVSSFVGVITVLNIGPRNAILSKQQECILENVSTDSVELGCILVARSCIDNKCDTLVLRALRMCDAHDLLSMGVEVFRGTCDKLPLMIQIVHDNIFTLNQYVLCSI
jgi:hypothetical protein